MKTFTSTGPVNVCCGDLRDQIREADLDMEDPRDERRFKSHIDVLIERGAYMLIKDESSEKTITTKFEPGVSFSIEVT